MLVSVFARVRSDGPPTQGLADSAVAIKDSTTSRAVSAVTAAGDKALHTIVVRCAGAPAGLAPRRPVAAHACPPRPADAAVGVPQGIVRPPLQPRDRSAPVCSRAVSVCACVCDPPPHPRVFDCSRVGARRLRRMLSTATWAFPRECQRLRRRWRAVAWRSTTPPHWRRCVCARALVARLPSPY
jgi:hypothetical protein